MRIENVVKVAIALAEKGVDYQPKEGAVCPLCKQKIRVVTTKPWDDGVRIRFHRCDNDRCSIHALGIQIKSVQERK
ncbi:ogr/Delta-like zinc finger family protein [Maridesulfovibrio ferrireducens]|uniref:ogr/Delta-like zinc finger family protein n=1 Tax=Maridesulfovibrio ferrireducens TaxID=246191 RepID=UPI001A30A95A|nr:ogr/Delta-like zinc finger family protein [Maridesulfovibrio ferrireducens]MBI9109985.1 ogr/Delta-like zinc finger family protein [Maridesulfovibrio ferrireducens]